MPSSSVADFQHVRGIAMALRDLVRPSHCHQQTPSSPHDLLPLNIEFSAALKSMLLDPSLSANTSSQVSRHLTASTKFYQRQYDVTARKLSQIPLAPGLKPLEVRLKSLQASLQAEFNRSEEKRVAEVIRTVKNRTPSRPRFHHEFIPVLEDFFNENPYPSRSERFTLAKKTNMTVKQIEVWFQNHRNRARKDGQIVTPTRTSPEKSPQTPPPDSSDESDPCSDSENNLERLTPLLAGDAPSDLPRMSLPFHQLSAQSRPTLPHPTWSRIPTPHQIQQKATISVDDLSILFATKLTLRDKKTKRGAEPTSSSLGLSRCGTKVVTLPAPLPSLVRPSDSLCPGPPANRRLRTRRLPRSSNHPIFSPYSKISGNPFMPANVDLLFRSVRRRSPAPSSVHAIPRQLVRCHNSLASHRPFRIPRAHPQSLSVLGSLIPVL